MTKQIKVLGNDAVDSGVVTVTVNLAASVSPLHFTFKREDGREVSFSLHHHSTKALLKLLVDSYL